MIDYDHNGACAIHAHTTRYIAALEDSQYTLSPAGQNTESVLTHSSSTATAAVLCLAWFSASARMPVKVDASPLLHCTCTEHVYSCFS